MKRYILTMVMALAAWAGANAMGYEQARQEALYLTDKMAYELNLNDQQYNDAYEINLDYFLSMNSERDLYADYLTYRLTDFRHILYDWQYSLMMAADYFVRPLIWRGSCWYFPIYAHYTHGHYFYSHPSCYLTYRGGHGHLHYHSGFYANRRPVWNGGYRGHDMGRVSASHHAGGRGHGYSFNVPNRGSARDQGHISGGNIEHNKRGDTGRNPGNYERNRGSYDSNRGSNMGSGNRGGYDSNRGSNMGSGNRGSYDGNRGSNMGSGNRGSYEGQRGAGMSRSGNSFGNSSSRSSSYSGAGRTSSPSLGGSGRSGSSHSGSFGGSSRGSHGGGHSGRGGR